MLWTIIVILLVLWLLGAFGPSVFSGIPRMGNGIQLNQSCYRGLNDKNAQS